MSAKQVESELRQRRNAEKAAFFPRFFKTAPGQYGHGDKFIGVVVPDQRKIARRFKDLPLPDIEKLLDSPWHECRLTGLFILVDQFQRGDNAAQRQRYDFYLRKLDRVNNWDLVDSTAHKIVGPFLQNRSRQPLYRLAKKKTSLWHNRVGIIGTLHFIKLDDHDDTIAISEILLNHPHDLIHKAVGWMLREVGHRDQQRLLMFLRQHSDAMPRTMLRYAIEKIPEATRKQILNGSF